MAGPSLAESSCFSGSMIRFANTILESLKEVSGMVLGKNGRRNSNGWHRNPDASVLECGRQGNVTDKSLSDAGSQGLDGGHVA